MEKINTLRKATQYEIDCAKKLRSLTKGTMPIDHKSRSFMQDVYFEIQDNGVDAEMLRTMVDLLLRYGDSTCIKMARGLNIAVKKTVDTPVYENIYSAVGYISNRGYMSHKKTLTITDVRQVLKIVCDTMGVDYEYALSRCRKRAPTKCRIITAWLCKDRIGSQKLAAALGRDNHTSIIHYQRSFNGLIERDKTSLVVYEKVRNITQL